MNNRLDKVSFPCAPTGVIPAEQLEATAAEMRVLWHTIARGKYSSTGLDRQQFWVLSAIEHGSARMSSLAEQAATSQASLTGIVDRLECRSLVERVRSSEDRRVIDVSLTSAGLEALNAMREHTMGGLEAVLLRLDLDERAQLLRLLRKLNLHESPSQHLAE